MAGAWDKVQFDFQKEMITVLQLWLGEVRAVERDRKKLDKIREENSTDLKKESVCVMCVS